MSAISEVNGRYAAYPVLHSIDGNWVPSPRDEYIGMTKREAFALAAMQGMCANAYLQEGAEKLRLDIEFFAKHAVKAADALLAELEKIP